MNHSCGLAVTLLAWLVPGAEPIAGPPTLIIEDARVIVGNGDVIDCATVIVEGQRIKGLNRNDADIQAPIKINGRNKTVMPGLIDTHVHLMAWVAKDGEAAVKQYVQNQIPTDLHTFLRHGITTVRSLADPEAEIFELRERITAGDLPGPRLLVVGPAFVTPGSEVARMVCGQNPWGRSSVFNEVSDPDDARQHVRRLAVKGVDAIKVAIEPGNRLPDAVFRSIIDEAHRHHLRVTVHTNTAEDAITAAAFGADGLEHGVVGKELTDDRLARALLRNDVGYVATLTIIAAAPVPAEPSMNNLKQLSDRGVQIAVGSDRFSGITAPGESTIRELEMMAKAGLSPTQIIKAATHNAAERLGLADELGTIEPGKRADLILISGDPLSDISAVRQIECVIQAGEVVWSKKSGSNASLIDVTPEVREYACRTVNPVLMANPENDRLTCLLLVSKILADPELGIHTNEIAPTHFMLYDKLAGVKLGFLVSSRLSRQQMLILTAWHSKFMREDPADVFFAPSADDIIRTKAAFGCSHYARSFIAVTKALDLVTKPTDLRYVISCKADDYNRALEEQDRERTINGHQFVMVRTGATWAALNTSKSEWVAMPEGFSPDLLQPPKNTPVRFPSYPNITFLLRKVGRDFNDDCDDGSRRRLMNILRSGNSQDSQFKWERFVE